MTNLEKEFEAWLEKEIPAINLIGREAAFACWQAAWGKAFQLASEACEDYDGDISIIVNRGDGRDVGPARITGRLEFNQPYGCSNGIVCKGCKIEWLTAYLQRLCAEMGAV